MSKVTASTDFEKVEEERRMRYVAQFCEQAAQIINGNIDFATNFNGKLLSITFSAANTDVSLAHGLNRVPAGYIPISLSASMVVYNGSAASSSTTLVLRASAAGTVGLLVF